MKKVELKGSKDWEGFGQTGLSIFGGPLRPVSKNARR